MITKGNENRIQNAKERLSFVQPWQEGFKWFNSWELKFTAENVDDGDGYDVDKCAINLIIVRHISRQPAANFLIKILISFISPVAELTNFSS